MISYNTLKEKTNHITLNGKLIKEGRSSLPFDESLYESGHWNEAATEFCIGTDRYCFYQNINIDTSSIFRDLSWLKDWVDIDSLNTVLCCMEKADKIIVGTPEGLNLSELNKEYPSTLDELFDGIEGDDEVDEYSISCRLFSVELNEEVGQEITASIVVNVSSFLLNETTCFGYGKGINYVDEGFSCTAVVKEEDSDPEDAEVYFCPVKIIIGSNNQ